MTTLLIRLQGPMQAYGTQDRFSWRYTEREPSFSAVIGLIALSALGRSEDAPIDDLVALAFGVRVDMAGVVAEDFHTVRGGKDGTLRPEDMVVSHRYYLAGAAFLAGLEGPRDLLADIAGALDDPATLPFLGRRAFPPSVPLTLPDGLREEDLDSALRRYPWLGAGKVPDRLRVQVSATPGSATASRMDVPLAWHREYAPRWVRDEWVPTPGGG